MGKSGSHLSSLCYPRCETHKHFSHFSTLCLYRMSVYRASTRFGPCTCNQDNRCLFFFLLSFLAIVSFCGGYGIGTGFSQWGFLERRSHRPVTRFRKGVGLTNSMRFLESGYFRRDRSFRHLDTIRNRTTGRNERGLGEIGETERGLNMMDGVCSAERRDLFLVYNSGINDRRMGYWSLVTFHVGSSQGRRVVTKLACVIRAGPIMVRLWTADGLPILPRDSPPSG
jgi:hypothetical protein